MPSVQPNTTIAALQCYHCGEVCNNRKVHAGEKYFCCNGCKTVYEILSENDLCTYYDLNNKPGLTQQIEIRKDKYNFLDNPSIKQKLIQFSDGKQSHITLYLPQIHCSSCLWLLENISTLNNDIISARVNFSNKEIFIVFDEQKTSLRKVVETLTAIGYEPHLSLQHISGEAPARMDRSRWYKIGIAGFCFSNIMMMSFPEYFSSNGAVEPEIKMVLQYIIVALSIPVLFYCAAEFFITAWKGLKNKYLNIDAPVALALVITFIRSLYEIISHTGSGYLDSMSGIVFFMLIGRWLQARTYAAIAFDRDFKSFFPIAVNVIRNKKILPVAINEVVINDIIQVHSNELIPVDGLLSKGQAEIDYSFVSGESLPVIVRPGEIIYAGGKQLGGMIELLVIKEASQSYLTNLWNKDNFNPQKTKQPSLFDIIGKYFTGIVLLIGVLAFCFWLSKGQYENMWNAITTVLIVACPCALLLSFNYTNGNILRILANNKLYLRSPEVIEDISGINHIVFDKTGTLTQNHAAQVCYNGKELSALIKSMVASLLNQSSHPASKAISHYLGIHDSIEIAGFKETKGQGIEGWIEDHYLKIGSALFTGNKNPASSRTQIFVVIDQEQIGFFTISNNYRFGILALLQQLKQQFKLSLLSGDNNAELVTMQKALGSSNDILFNQLPADKLAYIKHLQQNNNAKVMMIGDGLNDAGALKQSNVGIAVAEQNNTFTPASDGIIEAGKLASLYKFIGFAGTGRKIILFTFTISALYNIIGLWFAVQGTLSPVIAAILMPCSSITIILLTYGLTELAAKKYGMNNLQTENQ